MQSSLDFQILSLLKICLSTVLLLCVKICLFSEQRGQLLYFDWAAPMRCIHCMIYMNFLIGTFSWRRNESSIMRDWHWNWKSALEEFASAIIWGTFCRELIIIICLDCVNISGSLKLLTIQIGSIQRLYHRSSGVYYYLLLNLISISGGSVWDKLTTVNRYLQNCCRVCNNKFQLHNFFWWCGNSREGGETKLWQTLEYL